MSFLDGRESGSLKQTDQDKLPLFQHSKSSAMQSVARMIAQIAPTNIPVLLTGESGTGKEFVAQQVHALSPRKDGLLQRVVSASLTGRCLADYFERSTDGDAPSKKRTGTLFLKEISELDLLSQRDFLCAFSDATGYYGQYVGPRLLSSTVLDLEEEMREGRFRAELYYRINGVTLHLPALRERKEDIAPLAELFLARHAMLLGRNRPHLDARDFAMLQEFSWPGNIRELENVIKKIVILNDPKAVLSELFIHPTESRFVAAEAKTLPLKAATRAAVRGAEREMILAALDRTRWNRRRAAAELKISYKSLLCKLKQIGTESTKI